MSPYLFLLSLLAVALAQDEPVETSPAREEPPPRPRVQGNCGNLFVYDFTCNTLANNGHCESEASKQWMSKMCSKACNTCDATKHDVGGCTNNHNDALCEAWAVWGRCQEGGAIRRECAKSCNSCNYMTEQVRLERLDWLEPEPEEPKPAEPATGQPALRRFYK